MFGLTVFVEMYGLMRRSDFDLYRPLYVTVVYQGKCSHCMRIGVAVPLSGTVARLREAVSMETKIPTEQVRGPAKAHHT